MMQDQQREHGRYDELTAGYALDALDPQDEADFAGHLPGCAWCQEAVARFTEITGALADVAPAAEPSPALGQRIMAAVASAPAAAAEPKPAEPAAAEPAAAGAAGPQRLAHLRHAGPRRPRRPLRVIAASVAAAAALIAGGATWAGLHRGSSTPQPPAAGCVQAKACREITLTDSRSRAPAARLIIADGTAWLVPTGLAADNTAQQVYVLWQITGGHTPLAVGSFDVRGHLRAGHMIRVGGLAVPYSGTWAFAVSLEHGRTIPATPSRPVALGQVLS
jgi:anti-sigma-K factor RskA